MITDYATEVSSAQAITATAVSTKTLRDSFYGNQSTPLSMAVFVNESFAGAAKLDVLIETARGADFSDDVHVAGAVYGLTAADLPKGKIVGISLDLSDVNRSGEARHLRARYVVSGGSFSAGKVTTGVTAATDFAPCYATAWHY